MTLFGLPDPDKRRHRLLHEAELALIDAQLAREHWQMTEAMLAQRVARLRMELQKEPQS